MNAIEVGVQVLGWFRLRRGPRKRRAPGAGGKPGKYRLGRRGDFPTRPSGRREPKSTTTKGMLSVQVAP
ncbi:MAG TPA: hypothetical protein VNL94_06755 [Candidatus Binatia bacterium]|nr:hypothetical protein [Candidatus Binatia bacterium]